MVDHTRTAALATTDELLLAATHTDNPAIRAAALGALRPRLAELDLDTLLINANISSGPGRAAVIDAIHNHALTMHHQREDFLGLSGERHLGRLIAQYDPEMLPLPASRQAMLNELHARAIPEYVAQPHLTSVQAAVRHLATLIREEQLDGQDIADMVADEFNDLRPADRGRGGERTYAFLLLAVEKFDSYDASDLLRTATMTVLGW